MISSQGAYAPLVPGDEFEDEKEIGQTEDNGQISDSVCRRCQERFSRSRIVSMTKGNIFLCSIALMGVFLLGFVTSRLLSARDSRKAQVYKTDFSPARNAVELQQVRFAGSALFNEKGDPYFDYHEDETIYTGTPTEAIDKAWDALVSHRYFLINDAEALEAWGPGYKQYYKHPGSPGHKGGYVAGLDVLHTLHCVNMLRKALYKDHYPKQHHHSPKFEQYHVDHCLDIVRQSVQCNGDLTLIPTRWWPGLGKHGRNFIDSDQTHTCRNFDKIRTWSHGRWNRTHRYGKQHPPPADLAKHLEAIDDS